MHLKLNNLKLNNLKLNHLKLKNILAAASLLAATFTAHATPLRDFGPAPELAGIEHWINSAPLSLQQLRGKVVLVDFWTYTCVNCVRTLPYVKQWHAKYKDQGLAVIGVHTPEFPFERATSNVGDAARRLGLNYPIAQDNGYATWRAYNNQYWPAFYLINKQGRIVYEHFGEGDYAEMDQAIRAALAQPG